MSKQLQTIVDKRYRFVACFDPDSGSYYRTGKIKGDVMTYNDPFMASFPHLVDIGIMGHCLHGQSGLCVKAGVQCYQSGLSKQQPNMTLHDYQHVIDQCEGKVFQVALGGRGDPDLHEDFAAILAYTRKKGIVPNMTTSGYGLTPTTVDLVAQYCGAVAVSWYRSDYTLLALEAFMAKGVKTNIHYVLSNETLDEAICIIQKRAFPKGINRIIFLLHKPIGLGSKEHVLQFNDPKVKTFFSLFNQVKNTGIAGFDSCCVPALIHFAPDLLPMTYDTCEAARYSAYITPDLKMTPCSFDQDLKWAVDLQEASMQDAWYSPAFKDFRQTLKTNCTWCRHLKRCYGGCPLARDIVLCDRVQGGMQIEDKD